MLFTCGQILTLKYDVKKHNQMILWIEINSTERILDNAILSEKPRESFLTLREKTVLTKMFLVQFQLIFHGIS